VWKLFVSFQFYWIIRHLQKWWKHQCLYPFQSNNFNIHTYIYNPKVSYLSYLYQKAVCKFLIFRSCVWCKKWRKKIGVKIPIGFKSRSYWLMIETTVQLQIWVEHINWSLIKYSFCMAPLRSPHPPNMVVVKLKRNTEEQPAPYGSVVSLLELQSWNPSHRFQPFPKIGQCQSLGETVLIN